jgi:hypothetical protein
MVEKIRLWGTFMTAAMGVVLTGYLGLRTDLSLWLTGVAAWRFMFVSALFLWALWFLYWFTRFLGRKFDERADRIDKLLAVEKASRTEELNTLRLFFEGLRNDFARLEGRVVQLSWKAAPETKTE